MPDVGPFAIVVALAYVLVVIAVVALPVFVLRETRRRSDQLDRIERRLEALDRRTGPPDPR